jgi:predicted AAA+ superfamily ATPase
VILLIIGREIFSKLGAWKDRKDRKPLILQGARQTGKTWAMNTFGERYFAHTAYFNFEEIEELKDLFASTKDVKRLLGQLALFTGAPIVPQSTLLIFDEIQECNDALNSLKYFCENVSEYAVIAAGSLLGTALSKGNSFPVGKVDFLQMYPVTFKEFLAAESPVLYDFIENMEFTDEIPAIIFNRLTEAYRRYQLSGGMPEVVSCLLDNAGTEKVEERLQAILNACSLDFSKHAATTDIPRITAVWHSISSQLARENRKFVYKLVKPGARAREYEDALLWLQQAGLIHRVFCKQQAVLALERLRRFIGIQSLSF